MSPLIFFIFAS